MQTTNAVGGGSLSNPMVSNVIDALHRESKGDRWKFVGIAPRLGASFLRGRFPGPEVFKDVFISISPEQGRFVYLVGRSIAAKTVVEFGTSFGISTLYLAASVRDNGGGRVIGTEIEAGKAARATESIAQAGLASIAEVRVGDAMQTLASVEAPIDLVLLDGWKDLYLPVLKLLQPKLRPGAVVLADNIFTFKKGLTPYVDYVQSGTNGFVSTTLKISDGFEYSVYLGG